MSMSWPVNYLNVIVIDPKGTGKDLRLFSDQYFQERINNCLSDGELSFELDESGKSQYSSGDSDEILEVLRLVSENFPAWIFEATLTNDNEWYREMWYFHNGQQQDANYHAVWEKPNFK